MLSAFDRIQSWFPHIFDQAQSLHEFLSQPQCALSIATFSGRVLEHRDLLLTFTRITWNVIFIGLIGHIWPRKTIIESIYLSLSHNYINQCVWKTLLTMGVTIVYGHSLTTWVVEHVDLPIGKTNIPLRKEFPLAPIKRIVTLVLRSTFVDMPSLHTYHEIQKHCISQLWRNPQYLKNRKMISTLIWVNVSLSHVFILWELYANHVPIFFYVQRMNQ